MKKAWLKIKTFFVALFGSEKKLEKFLIENADEAIEVFTEVKNLVQSPIVDLAELLLPAKFGQISDAIQAKIVKTLDRVITELAIGSECLQKATFEERFACFVLHIKGLSPKMQSAAIAKGASTYVQVVSDKPLKESQADTAVAIRLAEKKIDSGSWESVA